MSPSEFLAELGSLYHAQLVFDENGICSVLLNDADEVTFALYEKDCFCVFADIGHCVEDVMLLKEIIASNGTVEDFDGSVITLDTDYDVFTLYRVLPSEGTFQDFERPLTAFVKKLRHWKSRLSGEVSSDDNGKEDDSEILFFNALRV